MNIIRTALLTAAAVVVPWVAQAQVPPPGFASVQSSVTLTQTSVPVPAASSTLLLAANQGRKSLRICPASTAGQFTLAYGPGQAGAAVGTSTTFGAGGVLSCEQYGPGDGVPTGAVYGWSAGAMTLIVGEGN